MKLGAYPKTKKDNQPNLESTPRNCNSCSHPDSMEDMVECEKCLKWYHYSCAGVDDSVKTSNFVCKLCPALTSKASISGRTSSSSKRAATVQIELQQLEEEKRLRERLLKEESQQEKELQEKENALKERAIQKERERKEKERKEKKQMEEEFISKKFSMMQSLLDDSDCGSVKSARSGTGKVQQWLQVQQIKTSETVSGNTIIPTVVPSQADKPITDVTTYPATEQTTKLTPSKGNQLLLPQQTQLAGLQSHHATSSEPYRQREYPTHSQQGAASSANVQRVPVQSEEICQAWQIQKQTPRGVYIDAVQQSAMQPISSLCYSTQPTIAHPPNPTDVQASIRNEVSLPRPLFGACLTSSVQPPAGQCTENVQSNSMYPQLHSMQTINCHPLTYTTPRAYHNHQHPSSVAPNPMHSAAICDHNGTPSMTILNNQPPIISTSLAASTPINVNVGPSTHQLTARQVVPKELPIFSGDPSDWPIFITSYNNSTQICGYSDSENLMRLQRSIKGCALDAVKCFLLHPSTVPNVLSTLYTLYGRPEIIANNLLNKIRSTPSPKADKLETLLNFGLIVQNLCAHLNAVRMENFLKNPMLLNELVGKLPTNIRLDWALYQRQFESPDLATFGEFMSTIVTAVSHIVPPVFQSSHKNEQQKEKRFINAHVIEENSNVFNNSDNQQKPCPVCQRIGHKVKDCFEFKKLDVDSRWKAVQQNHLCRRCLVPHGKRPCKSFVCGIDGCEYRHHRLLHSTKLREKTKPATTSGTVTLHHEKGKCVLFRIVPVTIYGRNISVDTFAFLDDGSELTLIDKQLADQLGMEGQADPLCLQWTGNVTRREADSCVLQLTISGREVNKKFPLRDVHTVTNLKLPKQTLRFSDMQTQFQHLRGLPVEDYCNVFPSILIGLNNTHLITNLKIREGKSNEPVAAKTRLGWSIHGSIRDGDDPHDHRHVHVCTRSHDEDLHNLVQNFFNIEGAGVSAVRTLESADDQRARVILEQTTSRTETGRFETGILWRYDYLEFPDSRPTAERRLFCLESRLNKHPQLYEKVRLQIAEYLQKGYAHKITVEEQNLSDPRRVWFLPLNIVVNPKKPEKLRLVWDAAAKTEQISFNSMVLKGPDFLVSLPGVLFRFRQRQIAVTGDIQEMFHQVLIRSSDRQSQRFLWRNDSSFPIDVYEMNVATFGSTCSPCSSQFVKNLNAKEFEQQYPRASKAILEDHYMDDYLSSFDSVDEAVEVSTQVRTIHEKAGFRMRNWLSNSKKLMEVMGENATDKCKQFTVDKTSECGRVLGLQWIMEEDAFQFTFGDRNVVQTLFERDSPPTKREILRFVMSFFDPLGLISMLVIQGKIILQDVWKCGLDWDEAVPHEIYIRWKRWLVSLRCLELITIPRCYFPMYDRCNYNDMELHVFVDASEEAYSSAAYFRIVERGEVRCVLVSSKTKVAPVKSISVPRLELQAAIIGVRLAKMITDSHTLEIKRRTFWTDSSTVLSWICSDHRRYKQYVAVRVGEILSESTMAEWRWVPSQMNVADEATKWNQNSVSSSESRWFKAPEFLYDDEESWPRSKHVVTETKEEIRMGRVHQHERVESLITFERFSKYERLIRAVAFVFFFARTCKKSTSISHPQGLLQEDLKKAETYVYRQVQAEGFSMELTKFQRNGSQKWSQLNKNSVLYKLSPYLDEDGIIRSDSRISEALCVPYEVRKPVILPKDHYVTRLLVNYYHRKFGHNNKETIVNELRQNFYICKMRVVVRKVAKECMWCRVYKSTPKIPRMAPLPAARLTPYVRPFTFVGLDYCGPFLIRLGRSNTKRWIALFTCMTVRAIHLEITGSLSTESCKFAIRRFIARRGSPQEIYSDQGTNFRGASNELIKEIRGINEKLADTFTNTATQWHFNPPASPHMGGAWERMVKTVKIALTSLSLPKKPDDEIFSTVVTEVEAMVNSRPLTYIPIDPCNGESLTPNHFLLLSSSGVVQPTKPPTDERIALKNNWNLVQVLLDQFWRRWTKEYLPTIANRSKWLEEVKALLVGDLVLIVDEATRNSWTRGRVIRVYPGKDGRIRRADIQTKSGILQRPVTKLAVLEIEDNGMAGSNHQQYGAGDVAGEDRRAEHSHIIN
ncbi:uncharacterized protein LOC129765605 [Toxorhynchites rutilus septentrionalis]|uniref:uncharacterized protein LOC129765605 n=1 Tax=Toxorhynchites rutilus septentrionalis TaxID=329112 RepID=UPI0024785F28|nr:uncharacterized protein LOC129765605 [Toxorhynchites rutilus septentrionalis]